MAYISSNANRWYTALEECIRTACRGHGSQPDSSSHDDRAAAAPKEPAKGQDRFPHIRGAASRDAVANNLRRHFLYARLAGHDRSAVARADGSGGDGCARRFVGWQHCRQRAARRRASLSPPPHGLMSARQLRLEGNPVRGHSPIRRLWYRQCTVFGGSRVRCRHRTDGYVQPLQRNFRALVLNDYWDPSSAVQRYSAARLSTRCRFN